MWNGKLWGSITLGVYTLGVYSLGLPISDLELYMLVLKKKYRGPFNVDVISGKICLKAYTFFKTVFGLFILGPRPKLACLRQATARKSFF